MSAYPPNTILRNGHSLYRAYVERRECFLCGCEYVVGHVKDGVILCETCAEAKA